MARWNFFTDPARPDWHPVKGEEVRLKCKGLGCWRWKGTVIAVGGGVALIEIHLGGFRTRRGYMAIEDIRPMDHDPRVHMKGFGDA